MECTGRKTMHPCPGSHGCLLHGSWQPPEPAFKYPPSPPPILHPPPPSLTRPLPTTPTRLLSSPRALGYIASPVFGEASAGHKSQAEQFVVKTLKAFTAFPDAMIYRNLHPQLIDICTLPFR